jgi:MFS family permease
MRHGHAAWGHGLGAFLVSCLLAFTAGHMFNYTVILYLQEAVGSDVLAGVGFGLAFGSSLVFGWFAGVLCDRVPPHRVIHGAQALFVAGLACLWWAQALASAETRVAWVLGGAFLGGLGWSFAGPARLTTLAQIATPQALRSATIVFNLQVLVGFGLAPLLIGLVRSRAGWGSVIALAIGGFVLASLLIVRVRSQAHATPSGASVLADVRAGFRVVGADPLLTQLMLAAVLGYAMTGPLQILLPKLAREVLLLPGSAGTVTHCGRCLGAGTGAARAPRRCYLVRHWRRRHGLRIAEPMGRAGAFGHRPGRRGHCWWHGHQPGGLGHSGPSAGGHARAGYVHVFHCLPGGTRPVWRGRWRAGPYGGRHRRHRVVGAGAG